jgi:hypothetical protein
MWDCHLRSASMAIPLEVIQKEKAFHSLRSLLSLFFHLLMKASFQRNEKTKPCRFRGKAFSFWVEDGIRTHDLRNHNPTF